MSKATGRLHTLRAIAIHMCDMFPSMFNRKHNQGFKTEDDRRLLLLLWLLLLLLLLVPAVVGRQLSSFGSWHVSLFEAAAIVVVASDIAAIVVVAVIVGNDFSPQDRRCLVVAV